MTEYNIGKLTIKDLFSFFLRQKSPMLFKLVLPTFVLTAGDSMLCGEPAACRALLSELDAHPLT